MALSDWEQAILDEGKRLADHIKAEALKIRKSKTLAILAEIEAALAKLGHSVLSDTTTYIIPSPPTTYIVPSDVPSSSASGTGTVTITTSKARAKPKRSGSAPAQSQTAALSDADSKSDDADNDSAV